jgi:8-oxo-dGTP pyrophosphatase MutT (NUDIX family)
VVFRVDRGQPLVLLIRDSYRNWGFPKGHVERGEEPEGAALRETAEETGLADLVVRQSLGTIEWYFRFRGTLIHKSCHFFLMESAQEATSPQEAEGITACKWVPFHDAYAEISYANALGVLRRAHELVTASAPARA